MSQTWKLIARGQYTIAHMHDSKNMQVNLNSNLPYVQFYSRQENSYVPNYRDINLEITPELFITRFKGNQARLIRSVNWEINGRPIAEFDGVAESRYPFTLKIAKNLTSESQYVVTCRCTVKDPDTLMDNIVVSSICFTKKEESNITPVLMLEYPNGDVFHNDNYSWLNVICKLMVGATDMSDLATYRWYVKSGNSYIDFTDDIYTNGQDTNTLTVLYDAVEKEKSFKCQATFNGKSYVTYASFANRSDPYVLKIENKNGDKMHNGEGLISCEAHMYRGDKLIPDEIAEKLFDFKWKKFNKYTGVHNKEWREPATRSIQLDKNDIDRLSTFMCEVNKKAGGLPYELPCILK